MCRPPSAPECNLQSKPAEMAEMPLVSPRAPAGKNVMTAFFVSKTTLTQQLPHHTADGISVVPSRFICKYKRYCEDKENLVKSSSRVHCEQKWGRSSVIRTVFHSSVEGRLVQVDHAVDSGVERKFGIHSTNRK